LLLFSVPQPASATLPSGCSVPSAIEGPVASGPTDRPRVSITYDESWGPWTRELARTYARFDMAGTFFAVGEQVRERPRIARSILHQGSEIGNHTWSHPNLTTLADSGLQELRRTQRVIRRVSGFRPCLMRPPGGYTNDALTAVATRLHLTTVMWNGGVLLDDSARRLAQRVLANIKPGDIVLEHQWVGTAPVEALPLILEGLRERGLRSVPVTTLLGGHFER